MTNLVHGPLIDQRLRSLTPKASILLHETLGLCEFVGSDGESTVIVSFKDRPQTTEVWAPSRFEYIGEGDEDGWITAPVGGWFDNPAPGQIVDTRNRNGVEDFNDRSSDWDWPQDPDTCMHDIVAFRISSLDVPKPGHTHDVRSYMDSDGVQRNLTTIKFMKDGVEHMHIQSDGYMERSMTSPNSKLTVTDTRQPDPPTDKEKEMADVINRLSEALNDNSTRQSLEETVAINALQDILFADIHHEGDDVDNYTPGKSFSSRTFVGPYGLIAKKALVAIRSIKEN